jgi:2-polyprenyl-3-methyl-5-hydroxy-6-metoxy-1,4-benzoquinol methylase
MTMNADPQIDEQRAEAFGAQMIRILSDASLALQLSIGHQLGLFDTMAGMRPSTSQEIADAAQLDERYVREWLGALTMGNIVEYDPERHRYWLPAEHAATLTRAAGPDNLARMMQFIPLLAEVEQPIIECFRRGGGVPYAKYPRFQAVMAEDSAALHDLGLVDRVLPLVEGLPARLEAGIDVCDVGCGRGHAINLMAKAYPRSRFVGYDFSEEAIEVGRREAAALGLDNVRLEARDVTNLDAEGAYDFMTAFDAIHDQAHPDRVLAAIERGLRPEGVFLMVDIKASSHLEDNRALPWSPFLYTVSTMHCMTVSLALDGAGLGTAWGEQKAVAMLAEAGFDDVKVKAVEGDLLNNYYVARRT